MSEETKPRAVTLMFRSENSKGEPLITSDRHAATRHGEIKRIFRSKKQTCPTLVACVVPKGTAPWEIASEMEPYVVSNTTQKQITFQVTDLGVLGDILLKFYAQGGDIWNEEILIVPQKFVPKQEREFKSPDESESSDKS